MFLLSMPLPPRSTLFPYTTLFRSREHRRLRPSRSRTRPSTRSPQATSTRPVGAAARSSGLSRPTGLFRERGRPSPPFFLVRNGMMKEPSRLYGWHGHTYRHARMSHHTAPSRDGVRSRGGPAPVSGGGRLRHAPAAPG